MDPDDYSVYSHLSDDELLQLAIERSLIDRRHAPPPGPGQSSLANETPHSGVEGRNPSPGPSRHDGYGVPSSSTNRTLAQPPANPAPLLRPGGHHVPNSTSPHLVFKKPKKELSYLQNVIRSGDTEALTCLVKRKCSSLTEPNDEGWTALHHAACYGALHCLTILTTAYPSEINKRTRQGQTPLALAAAYERVACVELLLECGADPNIANKDRETPLFIACESPNIHVVALLLRAGASVNRGCVQGNTPLHEAARLDSLDICGRLLEAGANLHAANLYGIQPLFTAAQHGYARVVHFFVEKGADINGAAADGATPLYEACKNGHVSTVEMLLSLKADVNRSTKTGLLPIHVAVQKAHTRVVSLLIPVTSRSTIKGSGISPLHIAADLNCDDIMELLLQAGFDPNCQLSKERCIYEDKRSTALYFSVYNSNLEATEMLLEAGANPNLDMFNPLLVAVRRGSMEMASLLLKYGADVNASISTQPSAFPSAVLLSMDHLPMLKLLLDHGCNARSCFNCVHDSESLATQTQGEEQRNANQAAPQRRLQFCDAVSKPSISSWGLVGPLISLLLNYVSHVRLCSRLMEHLVSSPLCNEIKIKAVPPHPLMQLCRLRIRHLVGVGRLKLLRDLDLPSRLIKFLYYEEVCCSLELDT